MKVHEMTYVLDDYSTAIIDNGIVEVARQRQQLSILHKQLVISLKFHHPETLKKLPLELALQAMTEVWQSCNPDQQVNG